MNVNTWINMNVDLVQETTHSPSWESWEEKNLKVVTTTEILLTDMNTSIDPTSPTR